MRGEMSPALASGNTICESISEGARENGEAKFAELQGVVHTGAGVDIAEPPNNCE